jgi:hypothetical protein
MNAVLQNRIIKSFCALFIEVGHYSKSNAAELSTLNIMVDFLALLLHIQEVMGFISQPGGRLY